MQRLIMLARLDLVLLFVMLYDMAVKPNLDDAGSFVWGVAGAAVAAALIYWRYRLAVAPGTGAPPATSEPPA